MCECVFVSLWEWSHLRVSEKGFPFPCVHPLLGSVCVCVCESVTVYVYLSMYAHLSAWLGGHTRMTVPECLSDGLYDLLVRLSMCGYLSVHVYRCASTHRCSRMCVSLGV